MSGDPKIKLYILGRLGYENVTYYNPISLAIHIGEQIAYRHMYCEVWVPACTMR